MLMVKSDTFQKEVMESNVPVLVDFFATWCGPCQMMGPVLEQLQAEYGDKAKIVKVDIDQAMDLAQKYRVMSVPNMIFFKDGQVADSIIGAVPASVLKEKMDKLVLKMPIGGHLLRQERTSSFFFGKTDGIVRFDVCMYW